MSKYTGAVHLLVTWQGQTWLDDVMPQGGSNKFIEVWARQRLEAGVTVEVVCAENGAILFTETVAA